MTVFILCSVFDVRQKYLLFILEKSELFHVANGLDDAYIDSYCHEYCDFTLSKVRTMDNFPGDVSIDYWITERVIRKK